MIGTLMLILIAEKLEAIQPSTAYFLITCTLISAACKFTIQFFKELD